MDVGYTVLVIPRNAVAKISKANEATPSKAAATASLLNAIAPQFYTVNTVASPARDVSDLVKQVGEAVVQVRTPEGLGSGFFINPDGYLITIFHVIEGETEISVEVYHQPTANLTARLTSRSRSSPSINFTTSRCCTSRTRTRRRSRPSRSAARTP